MKIFYRFSDYLGPNDFFEKSRTIHWLGLRDLVYLADSIITNL